MTTTYNNIPKEKSASSTAQTIAVFNQYYSAPTFLNNDELTIMAGFFEKRGFGKDAAESTSLVILEQAKKDGFSAMQVMDTLSGLGPVDISALVAEILNFNRFKTSALGTSQHYAPSEEVLRNIEGNFLNSPSIEVLAPPAPPPTISTNTSTTFTVSTDYIVIEYQFSDGQDLDTRTRLAVPAVGSYVGWGQSGSASNIVVWGGDNTGNGFESALIDVRNFKTAYPNIENITIDCRAQWYNTVGTLPVSLAVKLYTSGTMVIDNFDWTNPTATSSTVLTTVSKTIDLFSGSNSSIGERVGVLQYNVRTGAGSIDTNNTTVYP